LASGSELIEHEPGDLTCIVEAGMRLSELQAALGAHGQALMLDPPGDPTIGELLDGNLSGPRRHRYGAPRDLVIGMTVELADGTIASSGGKVVKNVAGYDLGKLFCGAGGRYGRIVRAAFRLHPIPKATATLTADFSTPEAVNHRVQALLRSQVVLSALDILSLRDPERNPKGARKDVDNCWRLALLFEGSERAVAAQVEAARALVGGEEDPSVWDDVAALQARGQRVGFARLDAFLAATPEAVVRVAALNAYVPGAAPAAWSPLAERIEEQLA
jgi:glycolate oxidase FAD binding subunit